MSGSSFSRRGKLDRLFYGSAGMTPIVAMLAVPQPTLAAVLPAANTVGVCSGVSLPKSTITNLVTPIVQAGIQPIETTTNAILHDGPLANLLGSTLSNTTLNVDLSATVAQVSAGDPITLQVLSDSGQLLGPQSTCYARADGVTLTNAAGLAIGGNVISGLGDTLQPAASAGDVNSIAFGNKATSDAGARGSVAIGTNTVIGASGTGAVAIGTASGVSALNGIALGASAQATGSGGVAIGGGASVSVANSVALGAGSTATRGAATYTGYALSAPTLSAGEVSVGAAGATRQLTNVAPGLSGTDAVTVSQLTAVDTEVQTDTTAIAGLGAGVTKNTADIATNVGDIAGLKTSVTQNTTAIAANAGDIVGLKTNVTKNTADIGVDTASIGGLTTRVTTSEGDIAGLKTNVVQNTTDISANTASIGDLTTRVTTSEGDIAALDTDVTRNTADIATNVGDIAGLKTSVTQNTTAIAANAGDIVGLKTNVTKNTADIGGNTTSIGGLTTRVTTSEGDIAALDTGVTRNTADIATNVRDIAGLKTNVAQNTTDISANTASIGGLTTRVTASEGDIAALDTGLTRNTADIATNVGDIAGLKTNVAQNTTDIGVDTASIGGLATRVTASEGDIAALDTGLTRNTADIATNAGDIAGLKTNVAQNTTDISANTASIGGLTTRVTTSEGDIATLAGQVRTNADDITTIDARVTRNSADIAVDTTAIGALHDDIANGAIGPVRYSDHATPTMPNNGVPSDDLTLVGASGGAVRLHDVAAGSVSATSTDAVNGSQLYAFESQVPADGGLGVAYDDDLRSHVTLGGTKATAPVGVSNLADGVVAAGSSDAVTGSQLFATNQSVGTLGRAVTGLSTTVDGYGARLDTLDTETAGNTGAIGVVGDRVTTAESSIAGLDTRVSSNTGAIAAVAGRTTTAELDIASLNGRVTINTGDIAANTTGIAAVGDRVTTAETDISGLDTRVGTNTGAIAALDTRVTTNAAAIATVDARVTGVNDRVTTNTGAIAGLDTRVTGVAGSVAALDGRFGAFSGKVAHGGVGPVQYSDAATPTTPDGGVPSNELTLVGAAPGAVGLHDVAAGSVSATSTDAVNGSQIYALESQIPGDGGLGVAYDDDTRSHVTLGGSGAATRVGISNLADGVLADGSSDAVTGSQLFATNQSVGTLGQAVSGLSTTVAGYGDRLTALDTETAADTTAIGAIGGRVTTAETDISGLDGRVTANTGAIAGLDTRVTTNAAAITTVDARVAGVNDRVTANTGAIAGLDTRVTGVAGSVAALDGRFGAFSGKVAHGGVGPVQYSDAATPTTPDGGVPSNELTLVGAAPGAVGLHDVAAGSVSATSTDAVNGSQLYAVAAAVTGDTGLAVAYDDASRTHVTLGGTGATTRIGLSNLADGLLAANSGDAVTGGQLYATNQAVGTLADSVTTVSGHVDDLGHSLDTVSDSVAALGSGIADGALGTVRYSDAATPATANGGVPSQDLTLVGAGSGAVGLHNVADGRIASGSSDAITGSQLYATNGAIATVGGDVERLSGVVTGLGGTLTTVSNQVATLGDRYASLDDAFTSFSGSVSNGAVGPVRYSDAATPTVANGGTPSQELTLVGAGAGTVGLHNLADGRIAVGSSDAVAGGQLATIGNAVAGTLGGVSYDAATNSFTGDYTYAGAHYATVQDALDAIRPGAAVPTPTDAGLKYFHTNSTEDDSQAAGANATAIGAEAVASGDQSVAMGNNAQATGANAVAIGENAMAQDGKAVSIGVGNIASGDGAVSIGDPNSAIGEGTVALGRDNSASGLGAIALGNTNMATGEGAVALGSGNVTNGAGAVSLGYYNLATGVGAIAIGSGNIVAGDGSLALGNGVTTSAVDTLAIGASASATAASALAIGNRSAATDVDAIAVGTDSAATDQLASAYGNSAKATKDFSTAIGAGAQANAVGGTATGTGAVVNAFAGTAIGSGATVLNDNSVALGAAVQTTRGALADYTAFGLDTAQSSNGEIAVAQNMVYTNPETGQSGTTGNRQITGVAAGSMDSDAVNVAQLRGVSTALGTAVASGLGGGAAYNVATGQVTGGSYTVSGVTYGNVGDAVQALASRGSGTGTAAATDPAAVHYGDATGSTVTLAAGGTLISNVAAGGVTAGSTDAVNGGQLADTNARVDANSAAIAGLGQQVGANTGAIATLAGKVDNGATGTVQYSSAATPTTSNGGTKSNDVTLVGADASAPVALHDVASGTVASGSTDAVNGGQLAITNARVATVETTAAGALAMGQASVQYDDAAHGGVTLGGASADPVAVHNVADGTGGHDAVNVGQLVNTANAALGQAEAYTDTQVARLSFDLNKVRKDQAAGTAGALALAGMPQPYEAGRGMIAMGFGTFQGQTALAVGLSKALSDDHTVVKLGATYNSRGSVGANAGVGYQF